MPTDDEIRQLIQSARNANQDEAQAAADTLIHIYLDQTTPDAQRQIIRDANFRNDVTRKAVKEAAARFQANDASAAMLFKRQLIKLSVMNGWPDPRDEYMDFLHYRQQAHNAGVDADSLMQEIAAISDEGIRHMLLTGSLNQKLFRAPS